MINTEYTGVKQSGEFCLGTFINSLMAFEAGRPQRPANVDHCHSQNLANEDVVFPVPRVSPVFVIEGLRQKLGQTEHALWELEKTAEALRQDTQFKQTQLQAAEISAAEKDQVVTALEGDIARTQGEVENTQASLEELKESSEQAAAAQAKDHIFQLETQQAEHRTALAAETARAVASNEELSVVVSERLTNALVVEFMGAKQAELEAEIESLRPQTPQRSGSAKGKRGSSAKGKRGGSATPKRGGSAGKKKKKK